MCIASVLNMANKDMFTPSENKHDDYVRIRCEHSLSFTAVKHEYKRGQRSENLTKHLTTLKIIQIITNNTITSYGGKQLSDQYKGPVINSAKMTLTFHFSLIRKEWLQNGLHPILERSYSGLPRSN